MYYISRPINIWGINPPTYIDISKKKFIPKLSYIYTAYEEETVEYSNPLEVVSAALAIKRKLDLELTTKSVICIINENYDLVLKTKLKSKLLNWANKEYECLSKCKECGKIFDREGDSDQFPGSNSYCSRSCVVKTTEACNQTLIDNEETEFEL